MVSYKFRTAIQHYCLKLPVKLHYVRVRAIFCFSQYSTAFLQKKVLECKADAKTLSRVHHLQASFLPKLKNFILQVAWNKNFTGEHKTTVRM